MDVRQVLPSARSVIVFGTIYNTDQPYSTEVADRRRGGDRPLRVGRRLSRRDPGAAGSHGRMAARAKQATALEARAYVDTGPVQERVFAQHAGLGWIGKNTCVINAEQRLLDVPLRDHLQSRARRRMRPRSISAARARRASTHVRRARLTAPRALDSRRCLSYLTIEIKGAIPVEQRAVDRRARLRLRHLPGGVSVQSRRRRCRRDPAWAARDGLDQSDAARPLAAVGRRTAGGS